MVLLGFVEEKLEEFFYVYSQIYKKGLPKLTRSFILLTSANLK